MRRQLIVVALVMTAVGCKDRSLTNTHASVRLSTDSTWSTWVGDHVDGTLSVVNEGEAPLELTWTLSAPDGPFTVEGLATVPAGESQVTVRFSPTTPGLTQVVVSVSSPGISTATLMLEGQGKAVPECPVASCSVSTFQRLLGQCVEVPAPDGTSCSQLEPCLENPTCQSGRCVGPPRNCNDHNACTVDVCNGESGCEHLPAPPCPGDGVCQVGVCNPATGCGLEPAIDGVSCGPLQSCDTAQVCMAGACVVRDPPDGFVCAEATPCTAERRCVGSVCMPSLTPSTSLFANWSYDSLGVADDAGMLPPRYHDFVMAPDGLMTLGNFFQAPVLLQANSRAPVSAPLGTSRRCIRWNANLVCADYPSSPNGQFSALDPATGSLRWTYAVQPAHREWVALTAQLFMARLVVLGPDRLAGLFEGYPASATDNTTQCRRYFVVVVDASGHEVRGQQITDPMLDQCNHPHPYGVAADQVGNLFIAFSPSSSTQAPLFPETPTLLVSYTLDGLFRWKRLDTSLRGGELAIAQGLLYPENSPVVLTAATGAPAFTMPQQFGRVVVSHSRVVPAPLEQASTLTGYEAGALSLRWNHQLEPGLRFSSKLVRLANWQTSRGARTVALTFVRDVNEVDELHAIDVADGRDAFTCPIARPLGATPVRTPWQLMEVANGSVGLMQGALDGAGVRACDTCDPPYAGSAAEFQSVPVTGISIAAEPWPGTFGGASHGHQEAPGLQLPPQ